MEKTGKKDRLGYSICVGDIVGKVICGVIQFRYKVESRAGKYKLVMMDKPGNVFDLFGGRPGVNYLQILGGVKDI